MHCTICIVSFNTSAILQRCLEALSEAIEKIHDINDIAPISWKIIVVDNASHDDSVAMVRRLFPHVECMALDYNSGFARANNMAFARSMAFSLPHENNEERFFILLNPDAFVSQDALREALVFMQKNPYVGACGALLLNEDGTEAPSARAFPTLWKKFCAMWGFGAHEVGMQGRSEGELAQGQAYEVDWVPGTFTVIRQAAMVDLNQGQSPAKLFDERFFMYYEETDLCRRLHEHGWPVYFVPSVRVEHIGGASAKMHSHQDSDSHNAHFDSTASQVTLWRMQSELLYIYKYHGLLGILANTSIEASRHMVRILMNAARQLWASYAHNKAWASSSVLDVKDQALHKRKDSQYKVHLLYEALRQTHLGRTAPPIPWK